MNASMEVSPAAAAQRRPLEIPSRRPFVRAGKAVEERAFATIRRRAVLEGCKWDPQVRDVSTLAPFPLILDPATWNDLATFAEQLTAETLSAEQEILLRSELLGDLGLPRAVRCALKQPLEPTPSAVRVMRFDFHPTKDGWRISEVNSDVPGGFTEASFFTELMREQFSGARAAGNPVGCWAEAIVRAAGSAGKVGLLTAPGFMEDHQIVVYLAGCLRERGLETHLANPTQVEWRDGLAHLNSAWFQGRLDTVIRFYQSEWLPSLPRRCGWERFLRGGRTPVGNPGQAVIPESKRFPLLWEELATPLPVWRRLLPESRDPRGAPWSTDDRWLLKSALSNTGDDVCIRELMSKRDWQRVRRRVWLHPTQWVTQRRFDSVPVDTPFGLLHACVGVYTIDGRVAGAYGRLAKRPLIDYAAVDAAVLVEDNP